MLPICASSPPYDIGLAADREASGSSVCCLGLVARIYASTLTPLPGIVAFPFFAEMFVRVFVDSACPSDPASILFATLPAQRVSNYDNQEESYQTPL